MRSDYPEPIFIVCLPRTGSTLLRYILDTHVAIYCPPECHVGPLMREAYETLKTDYRDPHDIYEMLNKEVHRVMYRRLNPKRNWCVKSVTTVDNLEIINKTFPKAKYICLYRHCLDFVSSALELISEGRKGFGFEDYLNVSKSDILNSLVEFWCFKTEKMLAFEELKFDRLRVTYESIVKYPTKSIGEIFRFLELNIGPDFVSDIFTSRHQTGRGDHKIQLTTRIETSSVGRGRLINVKRIYPNNLRLMNVLLEQLRYTIT